MKNKLSFAVSFLILLSLFACNSIVDEKRESKVEQINYKLWYQQPANIWDEALPVGNGRLGAMVFGDVYNETIQFNEESLWAGKRFNTNNPNALKDLDDIRQLIFEGKIKEAYELGNKSLLGTPPRFRSYQTFGNIYLSFDSVANYSDYQRELLLNDGISSTKFTIDGITYTREVFASATDNIIVVNIGADKPASINTTISLEREKDAIIKVEKNRLIMTGQIMDEDTEDKGPGGAHMKFAAKLVANNLGGEIITEDNILFVKNADQLTLVLTAATDYNFEKLNFDRSIDPISICENILAKAEEKTFSQIKESHIQDHTSIFNRVRINLGGDQSFSIPTDVRLDSVKSGNDDPALMALYFQYGRYLLMGSSRTPGILPANLQG
ncbi:MAG: glycoside hydrolase family 95 protein, partial [Bacteroidetes bacterium]